jgi:hypothetical protein
MRLRQYITESTNLTPENWEKLKNAINKDCKPFIKEIKGAKNLLLRGVNASDYPSFYKVKNVRKDRKPRMVDKELHKKLGELSKKLYGWNIREEGVFTTISYDTAKHWGQPVIVFPIGKFKYVWLDDVEDLYHGYDTWDSLKDTYTDAYKKYVDDGNESLWEEYIKPSVERYMTTNLKQYLNSSIYNTSECIINCDKYYSINFEWLETLKGYYCQGRGQ